jgi:hypothetical protein
MSGQSIYTLDELAPREEKHGRDAHRGIAAEGYKVIARRAKSPHVWPGDFDSGADVPPPSYDEED